jgi:cytoplasmic iron level regulating protein YaaA (DUF328/UPF0246 family)
MEPFIDLYDPTSPVLILIIDSFHKRREYESEKYDPSMSISTSNISDENKMLIKQNRQAIYRHLKKGEIHWRDDEDEISINENLKLGKDFFGNDNKAQYLPAMFRFWGDIYEGFGNEGIAKLGRSQHHILILSALYGFLRPYEPIQYYACQFGDKNLTYDIWTKNGEISQILADYILKYRIKKIFDFTSCEVAAYHECINWDYIKEKTDVEVLHCYHRFAKRDQALKPFGLFIKNNILSEMSEKLIAIKPGFSVGDVTFSEKIKLSESETLRRLIEKGEDDQVEFKSSSLWSLGLSAFELLEPTSIEIKKYQKLASKFILARSIASLLNMNGGHLIIGVKEDRTNNENVIIGIEREYHHLRLEDRNPDGYRRMIIDMIIKKFVPDILENFSNYVTITFHKISGKTVCWLQIRPAKQPIFVELGSEEIFFVRIDASSRMVTGKALTNYVLSRFPNNLNFKE